MSFKLYDMGLGPIDVGVTLKHHYDPTKICVHLCSNREQVTRWIEKVFGH